MTAKVPEKNRYNPTQRLTMPHAAFRTAAGNGTRVLEGVDGRSSVARRYTEIASDIVSDLGGKDEITALQLHLVKSVAGLIVLRERIDAKVLNGDSVCTTDYCRLTNSLRRVAATLGLERKMLDITPKLTDILREHRRPTEDIEDADYEEAV